MRIRVSSMVVCGCALLGPALQAWDYAGHRIVNQTALAALPEDFPGFVREAAAAERIAFLSGEPDRWRNAGDLPHKHANVLDHYLDLEDLPTAGMDIEKVPSLRYEFAVAFAAGRAANADKFAPIDPAKNADRTSEWPGFAPWTIAEYYGRLRSAFAYLKVFEEIGTPEEVANARANAVYVMGVMGHYVGDLAQPLHTTVHYNGWAGDNPRGYTTSRGFHSWVDGGFLNLVGVSLEEVSSGVAPAAPMSVAPRDDGRDPVFVAVMDYLREQHAKVELLYQLDQTCKLTVDGSSDTTEGAAFLKGQLRRGGEMLAALWVTAWRNAPPDTYLKTNLLKRQATMPAPVKP